MVEVFVLNCAVIALVVVIHYEFLRRFTLLMPKLKIRHRLRLVFGVFGSLAAHTLEVWVFGIVYYYLDRATGWGSLAGSYDGELLSAVYFSFTAYTTLGLGDVLPHGDLRFLVGLESLAGFVLITWTASFLYLEMTRYWDSD